MKQCFLPGATIGVMGGGQLGRMLAVAARQMGYRIHVFSPEANGPAAQFADHSTVADYADETAVKKFAREIDVLTFEFENIPVATVDWCAESLDVRPSASVLHVAQHRLREKRFLTNAGIPVAPFREVTSEESLGAALRELGGEGILKSAAFGYDGKGQQRISGSAPLSEVWASRPGDELILEQRVEFQSELSVIVARGIDGESGVFPPCENLHANHILDVTVAPARIDARIVEHANEIARTIAEKLELVGLLAVEMFLTTEGKLLVNELAPRPHNSGHWTIEGCATSQFEQQLRAVCGLPLGNTELVRPSAMANLLGDVWVNGEPNWPAALAFPGAHLHLYGKSEPRPGRKMGHVTVCATSTKAAIEGATQARASLLCV